MDGSQRIVALVGHGLEIAGDSAVGLGVAEGSEAAGDLLLDLGHADIALGAGVGERGIAGEAQHLGVVLGQRLVEVLGIGLGDAPALSVETGGGLFPCGLGEDGPGARARGREGCLVESLGIKFTDPAAGSAQEVAQALVPDVAVGVLDEPEVAQQVGTAQGVLTVISGEGAGPSVVDQNATRAGDDSEVVDGGATAPSVDERHPQVPGTDAVHPVVRAIDAQAGLVGVQGGHGQQTVDGCGFPVGQRLVQAHQPGQQGRLGHGAPGQGLEGLRGAPERHHLGSHEMRGEGQDAVAVLQRSRHIVREGAPVLGSRRSSRRPHTAPRSAP